MSIPPNPPMSTYHPNSRARANTINNMDAIPPALARLQHMNHDVISGRNALTPVLNRDDAMREWERRQTGKAVAAQTYQPLEYLHQQAELAAAQGFTNWNQPRNTHRYPAPPSSLSQSYQPTIIVDDPSDRREVVMSSVRSAARGEQQSLYGASNSANLASPPQAYVGNVNTRYGNSYSQQPEQGQQQHQQQQANAPFDALDRGRDIASIYVPMQPDQYHGPYGPTTQNSEHRGTTQAGVTGGAQSFYNPGVVASGATQRNPFVGSAQNSPPIVAQRDGQRAANGMDIWPR